MGLAKFVGFVVGAVEIAVGIATGNPALIITGALTIASSAASLLLAPKAPARTAQEMSLALGEGPRVAVFGETAVAGSLVDAFNYGGKYGTDWEVLVIRLADHKCDSLVGFYVDDEYVEYTGNGNYPAFDGDHFELYFRADTTNETITSVVTTYGPGWTSSDTGDSGCDVVVAYRADGAKAKKLAWPGGRPRFLFVLRGKLCYDPRLDSTVSGGSGTHRWTDPSTWEWSDNPAVCRYNWVRGIYVNDDVETPSKLLIGRGLTAVEAPPGNVFDPADICDELDGDSNPLYRVAGPVYADQEFLEVEEMFAAACAGSVVTREGSVELEPGVSKSVVASFTDEDLVVGANATWNQGILSQSDKEWVNTVVARYVEPDQKWNDHAAPVVRDTSEILEDGRPREASITLRLVRYQAQALRIAEITRRMGRRWGRATVTLGPRFCEIEDGDWIEWTSDRRFGGDTKTFRVEAYSIDEKWQNTLTLREITADCYEEGTFDEDLSEATPSDLPPDIGTPDGASWSLTAGTIDSAGASVPAMIVTGESTDDDYADEIIFEYWKDDGVINPVTDPDDPDWITFTSRTPIDGTLTVNITGVEGGADYYVAVTYVIAGEKSDRLILGPVTVADLDVSPQIDTAVSAATSALAWKQPVRVATAAPGTLASSFENGDTVDGVVLATGNRILIKDQASGTENGIYVVNASGAPTRATDADTGAKLLCAAVRVSEGTANADTTWFCTNNATITIGVTNLAFASGGGGPSAASTTEVLTGTDSSKYVTPDALASIWEQGSDITSGGTISVGEGGYFVVTGTTTITDIDYATDKAGRRTWLKFAGALTLTHNASTLILPTGANITTAAGDIACFVSEGSDVVRCVAYQRASGAPLVLPNASANSKLLGSGASGSGAPYGELSLGTGLEMAGTTLSVTAEAGGSRPWWWEPPLAADLTVASTDGTTPTLSDDSDVGLIMANGNCVAGNVARYAYKTAPASNADWVLECHIIRDGPFQSYIGGGLIAYESSTGKSIQMLNFTNTDSGTSNAFFSFRRLTNSTFNAEMGLWACSADPDVFLRLGYTHSGTIYWAEVSVQGKSYARITTVSKATAFTSEPNRVGIVFHNALSASIPGFVTCDRWVQSW